MTRFNPIWALIAPLGALLTFTTAAVVMSGMHHLIELPIFDYMKAFRANGLGLGTAVLCICVQPAVIEELAFRGIIQRSLQPSLSRSEAIVATALMFMILHLQVPNFPHLLLLGLVLGVLRELSGSLISGMLLHFTHNLLALLLDNDPHYFPHWLASLR